MGGDPIPGPFDRIRDFYERATPLERAIDLRKAIEAIARLEEKHSKRKGREAEGLCR